MLISLTAKRALTRAASVSLRRHGSTTTASTTRSADLFDSVFSLRGHNEMAHDNFPSFNSFDFGVHRRSFSTSAGDKSVNENEGPKEQQEQEQASTSDDASASADATAMNQELTAKVESLEAQVKDVKDQLLRSLAEQENIRTIANRDVDSARKFAISSFAKSLLEVADNLGRALESSNQQDTESSLYQGIQMTQTELLKTLAKHGITPYTQTPGEAFDPNLHNALFEFENPDAKPGTVGQVIKAGYKLHDRVLRPAEVGVVKK